MLWQYAGLMLHELGYILRPRTTQLLLLRDKADIFYFIPLVERMWRCIRPGFTRVEQISKPWRERALTKFGEMEEVQLFYKQLLIDIVLIYFSLSYFNFNILCVFSLLSSFSLYQSTPRFPTPYSKHTKNRCTPTLTMSLWLTTMKLCTYITFSFFFSLVFTTPEVLAASFHSRDQSLALPFPGTACPPDLLLFALFCFLFGRWVGHSIVIQYTYRGIHTH